MRSSQIKSFTFDTQFFIIMLILGVAMKILYGLLVVSIANHSMLRPARQPRPQHARNYSNRITFQIKITNPKLLASLEAARTNATQHEHTRPEHQTKKSPTIISGSSSRHNQAFAPQSSFSHMYTPSRPAQAGGLAHATVDIAEGYLEYKALKKMDEMLFEHPTPVMPPMIPTHDEDDGDED